MYALNTVTAGGYEIHFGDPGRELRPNEVWVDTNDPLFRKFHDAAAKGGWSQSEFEGALGMFAQSMEQVGPDAAGDPETALDKLGAFLGPDAADFADVLGDDPRILAAIGHVADAAEAKLVAAEKAEAQPTKPDGPMHTEAELKEMCADERYTNPGAPGHREYREAVERAFQVAYGDAPPSGTAAPDREARLKQMVGDPKFHDMTPTGESYRAQVDAEFRAEYGDGAGE